MSTERPVARELFNDEDTTEYLPQSFPTHLQIYTGNYRQKCKYIYTIMAIYIRCRNPTLQQLLDAYYWEDYGYERPTCTDDVEKTIFNLFDEYGLYEGIPWFGYTHETNLRILTALIPSVSNTQN